MTQPTFHPPFDAVDRVPEALASRGYAIVDASGTARIAGVAMAELAALVDSWGDLPADAYLKDGGRYRQRRHACFVVDGERLSELPRRAHWQPLEYNALHGGMARWFEPIAPTVAKAPAWAALIEGVGRLCTRTRPERRWFVEAHQFRIDTKDGIGRPTPEGAHRDGVDFVAVLLIRRCGVKGGETRVFDATSPNGLRFTMVEPWTMLLLDDARVIHETTPIQPLDGDSASDCDAAVADGVRDTLVLTYRAAGFQGDNGEADAAREAARMTTGRSP